jgi:hypothetical protein
VKGNNILLSFVVDKNPDFYYMAELLLFSLKRFAHFKKENIQIQCTEEVDQFFIDFLVANNYSYNFIKPNLDKKYCNKIHQLDYFCSKVEEKIEGVLFIDTDMFFIDTISIPDKDKFCAKIVDAPNPPLKILQNIFFTANIRIPEITSTDFVIENGHTFKSNFNGGFYYIPKKYLSDLRTTWQKWATWLFSNQYLIEDSRYLNHIDQISMALSVNELNINFQHIDTNLNYPIHCEPIQKKYLKKYPIKLIHYHWLINSFGLFPIKDGMNTQVRKALIKANKSILNKGEFQFINLYKKYYLEKNQCKCLTNPIIEKSLLINQYIKSNGIRLIIHAGTPKTGTTSLQYYLKEISEELKRNGFLYVEYNCDIDSPKHQWIVTSMMGNDDLCFATNITSISSQIDSNTHTIILSCEGIFNHWQDFPNNSKNFLYTLQKHFNTELWIWFREPISFIESYYIQTIKNQKNNNTPCFGKNISLDKMLMDEWFTYHLNYTSFIQDIKLIINNIKVFEYKTGSTIIDFMKALNFNACKEKNKTENTSLSLISIFLIRLINFINFENDKRNELILKISNSQKYLLRSIKYSISKKAKLKINNLFKPQLKTLNDDFNIFKNY